MIRFITQKILNKKWLVLSILIGNILLIAIACCNPMYTKAALQKMLTKEMNSYLEEENTYPGTAYIEAKLSPTRLEKYTSTYFDDYRKVNDVCEDMYGIDALEKVALIESSNVQDAKFETERSSEKASKLELRVASLSNLEDHITIISGEMYQKEADAEGIIDCIVNERVYLSEDMVVGDVIRMTDLTDIHGNPVRLRIAGVFCAEDTSDVYWVKDPLSYQTEYFIDQELFISTLMDGNNVCGNITGRWYTLFDYANIEVDQVSHMLDVDRMLSDDYAVGQLYYATSMYGDIFYDFMIEADKVTTTMWILQVPILVLLAVFIFMVSNQVISIEAGEIAMLKSRGVSRFQLILTYVIQSAILAGMALVIGIPLGYLLCHVFGSTNAFLEFVGRKAMHVTITGTSLLYALIAAFASIVIMTAPVLKYARVSIVEQKANKRKRKQPMWQRMFLDLALLALSLYGFYNFNSQKSLLLEKVADGEALDPMLFLSASLFILSCAIVFLRVIPFLSFVIFRIGRKHWKPAWYASFLQITRDARKQNFITVFLVLTIALGIFNANIARTVNENEEMRLKYDNGANLVLQEQWASNQASVELGYAEELEYTEADFSKYEQLAEEESSISSMAKVLSEKNAMIGAGGTTYENCQFMAIHTKDFGNSAWMPEGYTEEHWFNDLNALSQIPDGAIISTNLAREANVAVGDTISLYRYDAIGDPMGRESLKVVAIVEIWPSYENKQSVVGEDGISTLVENYLVVTNLENVLRDFDIAPYQIWMHIDGSTDFMYDWAEENNIVFSSFKDTSADIIALKNNPYFQVTNGMLTITFIVVLVLCAIGFLIYWITSIRSRELIFGIYRAMGMSMKELIVMLINEHLFGSMLPILFGAFVGILASKLFIPLIEIAYSPTVQTLATQIFQAKSDMIRIGVVVFLMLAFCIVIISVLLSKIKISQALKLGED